MSWIPASSNASWTDRVPATVDRAAPWCRRPSRPTPCSTRRARRWSSTLHIML
ncbi:unnamed protein product [Durusdinium trenchii]|uniref:Uncharacterized protein n=1 Tax=Durusdinium trenchii TaxID=1381693 RepID=A0ABP0INA8_9DINO